MNDSQALFDAITAGDAAAVRRLLKQRPELARSRNERGVSALLQAHYRQNPELITALLQAKPELDIFDAAAVGDTLRVQELIDADSGLIGSFSSDGWTPLHLSCFFGRVDAARLLLEAGADPSAGSRNSMANTPLHAAAAGRHLRVCRLLLQKGADPDARQHGGYTALHSAALHGDRDLLNLLLEHGADPSIADDEGEQAVDYARKGSHREIAELLTRHEPS